MPLTTCPMNVYHSPIEHVKHTEPCVETRCAWWNYQVGACAILVLSIGAFEQWQHKESAVTRFKKGIEGG